MSGLQSCNCGEPDCDRMECVTCHRSDCKWPGECYGKCIECGGQSPLCSLPMADGSTLMRDDGRPVMDMHCSRQCMDTWDARERAAGRLVSLSDMSLESANKMFQKIGMRLDGVGPVVRS